MKTLTVAATLAVALSAVPVLAQQKPPAQKPAAAPARPATQKPAPPAAQATPAPRPFPEGAKVAYCSLDRVAAQSKEGQAAFLKVKALNDEKIKLIQDRTKAMEANQALIDSPSVPDEKKAALQREVARQQVEIQRLQQDAQAEVTELQTEVRDAFVTRVMPIIQQIAVERGLHLVLNYQEDLMLWVDSGLDLSAEVAKRLDAAPPAKLP